MMNHIEEKNVGESLRQLKEFVDSVKEGAGEAALAKKPGAEQAIQHLAGIHGIKGYGEGVQVQCCCDNASHQEGTKPAK